MTPGRKLVWAVLTTVTGTIAVSIMVFVSNWVSDVNEARATCKKVPAIECDVSELKKEKARDDVESEGFKKDMEYLIKSNNRIERNLDELLKRGGVRHDRDSHNRSER